MKYSPYLLLIAVHDGVQLLIAVHDFVQLLHEMHDVVQNTIAVDVVV